MRRWIGELGEQDADSGALGGSGADLHGADSVVIVVVKNGEKTTAFGLEELGAPSVDQAVGFLDVQAGFYQKRLKPRFDRRPIDREFDRHFRVRADVLFESIDLLAFHLDVESGGRELLIWLDGDR